MIELRRAYPKLDMPEVVIRQFASPPHSPQDCVFALTTQTLSADLKTRITPCQFGGNPDCASCGCIASMGLASVAAHKLGGILSVGSIFKAKPAVANGKLLRSVTLSSTIGPVIKIDTTHMDVAVKHPLSCLL